MEWPKKNVRPMIQELIFATGNQNKASEIQTILGRQFLIKSLKDIGFNEELQEPFDTLEANAKTKAEQLRDAIDKDCFAEDSGLFVNALNGAPGVFSARYSGEHATDRSNIELLLNKLQDEEERSAYFKTVIHLIQNDTHYSFSGICKGHITLKPIGEKGFGYDPIFIPDAMPNKTFAQLSKEEKNTISHRAKATEQFIVWLKRTK